jgi:hypothetical protein
MAGDAAASELLASLVDSSGSSSIGLRRALLPWLVCYLLHGYALLTRRVHHFFYLDGALWRATGASRQ